MNLTDSLVLLLTEIGGEEGRGGTWLGQGSFLFSVPSFNRVIGKNHFVLLPVYDQSFILADL